MVYLRVIHHQSQGLAMPRLEERDDKTVFLPVSSFKALEQLQELLLPEIHSVLKTFYKDFHYLIQRDFYRQPSIGDSS